jgi:hypothetical protein
VSGEIIDASFHPLVEPIACRLVKLGVRAQ